MAVKKQSARLKTPRSGGKVSAKARSGSRSAPRASAGGGGQTSGS